MTPDEMREYNEAIEKRERDLLDEMNEISGAVKWDYKPFIHFPAGMRSARWLRTSRSYAP